MGSSAGRNFVDLRREPGESELGRIRRLLEKPVDWEMVLRLVDNHGTSSLLYQNLSPLADMVPASTLASLRQRYERNIYKSLFLARELMRIVDRLDGLGVDAVPYKGVVMSEVYYGDMALRQSGDMDLFVRKRDVRRIKSALRDLEYTTRLVIPEELLEDYIAAGYEWTFDSPAGPNLLELQWALQPRFYAVDFDMDGLFERAVKRNGGGPSGENAFSGRSAAGAVGACGETHLGTGDLAVRHRADFEAGEPGLGSGAGSNPGIGDRADTARHAVIGKSISGNCDSGGDRERSACGSGCAGFDG